MTESSAPLTLSPSPRDDALEAQVHIRWDVKTGSDPVAKQIDRGNVSQTSIAELLSAKAPETWPPDRRVEGVETTVWELNRSDTTLVGYKHEQDGDYHLVISDANGQTMIAEIPDPAAVDPGSSFLDLITSARTTFGGRFGLQLKALDALASAQPGMSAAMIIQVSFPVSIKGIGFFDFVHGQSGVAPNGIELHPVLGIEF
jgi:hypothetical protein